MNIRVLAFSCALTLATAAISAEQVPVEALLNDTQHTTNILQAEAELDGARHELERNRGQKGWQLTASAGYGVIKNIVDENKSISYPAAQGTLGFSYPLLGSSEQHTRSIDVASGKVEEKQARLEDARRRAPLEIESNYARYWGAQEGMVVIDAFLSTESVLRPRLEMRQQKKLMLESQLTELVSGYAGAHADRAQLQRVGEQTRARLERLSGRQLTAFEAVNVSLPPIPDLVAENLLKRHPEINALRAQAQALKSQLHDSAWYGMDASFNVMGAVNTDQRDHQTGGTGFVGLNFSAPLSLISVRREERRRIQSELDAINLQQRERSEALIAESHVALDRLAQAIEAMDLQTQKTRAAAARLRERQLRSGVFSDEGIEALSQQLREYTTQALADIDARVAVWQANIDARLYLSDADHAGTAHSRDGVVGANLAEPLNAVSDKLQGGNGKPIPASSTGRVDTNTSSSEHAAAESSVVVVPKQVVAAAATASNLHMSYADRAPVQLKVAWTAAAMPVSASAMLSDAPVMQLAVAQKSEPVASSSVTAPLSVYVWDSHDVISRNQFQPKFWDLLQRLSIRRLMLSLNAAQIRAAQDQTDSLKAFLTNSKSHGVAVELLLGEPTWIESANRKKLTDLIGSLRGFEFSGLHLDIEPDQLYQQPLSRKQFDNWVQTMTAAAKASPWPTAVSVHPRYFRDAPYRDWQLSNSLKKGGISEVALMIFSSDPKKVAEKARPILKDAPGLRFRIAQSVEPELEPSLSYARRSPEEFQTAMLDLQKQISTESNADGVAVQAWADLLRMGYESQIR